MQIHMLHLLGLAVAVQAILRLKFQHWFPTYGLFLESAAANCSAQIQNYYDNIRTAECPAPCACAADCIQQNITPTIQSNFTSAQVLLALVPTILIVLGPSIVEMAALSTYKPLLAIMLALGSPAVNFVRLFVRSNAKMAVNKENTRIAQAFVDWLNAQHKIVQYMFEASCYAVALTAIASNVANSVRLDLNTICGWRCGAILMPLAWALLAVTIHGWGMFAIRFRGEGPKLKGQWPKSSLSSITHSKVYKTVIDSEDTAFSQLLFWLAHVYAIIHYVFGTFDLSSLVFISALEALYVAVLYLVSAAACQLILLVQLAKMRDDLRRAKGGQEEATPMRRATCQRLNQR